MLLKQSTARNRAILMIDSADHISGKTGLTLTITASKDGAAFASITPTVTELSNGWYKLALTTAHTDTLGDLALHITATGADPTDIADQVVALLPGDSVTVGTNNDKTGYSLAADQAVNVTKVNGTAQTARDLGAQLDATVSSRLAPTVAGRTLDVASTGEAGLDFNNINDAGGAHTLTNITVPTTTSVTNGVTLTAAAIQAIWDALTSALTTVGSIGKLLVTNIDAAISSRSTYAGTDTAGTTTLLGRLTAGRATNLDNLDAAVSSRLASASYTAPDNASITAIKAKTNNLPASPLATGGDVNVKTMNGAVVQGTGVAGDLWRG